MVPGTLSVQVSAPSPVNHPDPRVQLRQMTVREALQDRARLAWALTQQRPRPPGWGEPEWAAFLLQLPPERLLLRGTWAPTPMPERFRLPAELHRQAVELFDTECFGLLKHTLETVVSGYVGSRLAEMRSTVTSQAVAVVSRLEDVLGVAVRVDRAGVEDSTTEPHVFLCTLDVQVGAEPRDRRVLLQVKVR